MKTGHLWTPLCDRVTSCANLSTLCNQRMDLNDALRAIDPRFPSLSAYDLAAIKERVALIGRGGEDQRRRILHILRTSPAWRQLPARSSDPNT